MFDVIIRVYVHKGKMSLKIVTSFKYEYQLEFSFSLLNSKSYDD